MTEIFTIADDTTSQTIEESIPQRELSAHDPGTTIEFEPNLAAHRMATQFLAAGHDAAPRHDAEALRDAAASRDAPIDSSPRPSTSPGAEAGRVLRDRYVLENRLGRGGMGTVFKALDRYRGDLPESNRHVAIKFLHEKVDGRAQTLSNLRREFYCAQALSHPNIVKVYELDLDGDAAFFTMELLDGELLSSLIERLGPQTISRTLAWTIIREVGAALAHAHSRNVAHGDLKPQNIIITKSGEVRLLDFGASSAITRQLAGPDAMPRISTTALTPAYACCELLEGKYPDPRDDLYALACLSYELLAGKHPFERRRSSEARDRGMLAQRPPGLTRQQWETLAKGLAWNRQDRSMAVRDWVASLTAELGAPSSRKPLLWIPWRHPVAAALVVLLAGIALGVSLSALFRGVSGDHKVSGSAAAIPPPAPPAAKAATSTHEKAAPTDDEAAKPLPEQAAVPSAQAVAPPVRAAAPPAPAAAPPPTPAVALMPSNTAATPHRPGLSAAKHDANRISIATNVYKIGRGQNFAEIHISRSPGSEASTSFVWWTEPSTAKPGIDYVDRGRVTQLLPRGKRMGSLFVRLIPNPSRSHPGVFHVVIGEPGDGTSLGRITRASVQLPAK
jgi:serine/threonine protein kinase